MFSTPSTLARRTGKFDTNRPNYLKQLVEEYQSETTTEDKKLQVLANLANFAYDPINYEYFRRFNILDIFISNLSLTSTGSIDPDISIDSRISFSLGAICNSCLDTKNKEYFLKNNLLGLVINCLIELKQNDEIILNSIAVLLFLLNDDESVKKEILKNKNLIDLINEFNKSTDKRISNLAKVFLEDICEFINK